MCVSVDIRDAVLVSNKEREVKEEKVPEVNVDKVSTKTNEG